MKRAWEDWLAEGVAELLPFDGASDRRVTIARLTNWHARKQMGA
jgi:hypothetical protein